MEKKFIQIELLFSIIIVIIVLSIITLVCVEIQKQLKVVNIKTEASLIASNIFQNINLRTFDDVNEYIQDFSGVGVSKKLDESKQKIAIIGNEFSDTFFGTEIPNGYEVIFEVENISKDFDISKNILITIKENDIIEKFSTILEKENIQECNSPIINDAYLNYLGFTNDDYDIIPIKYSYEFEKFIVTNRNDKEWYNYSSKKWAKVLIFSSDGDNLKDLFIDENGIVKNTVEYADVVLDITNYIYIWIPNFSIKDNISYFRYGTSKKAIKLDFRNYNGKNLYLNRVSEEISDISEDCSFDGIYGVWRKLNDYNDIYYQNFNKTKFAPINLY